MSIFSKIWAALQWFGKLFTSRAAKDALGLVNEFLPQVAPIVQSIQKIVPSVKDASWNDISNAYKSFGIVLGTIEESPSAFGQALAQLALAATRDKLGDKTTPERIIKAAIEIALVGLKAK